MEGNQEHKKDACPGETEKHFSVIPDALPHPQSLAYYNRVINIKTRGGRVEREVCGGDRPDASHTFDPKIETQNIIPIASSKTQPSPLPHHPKLKPKRPMLN